ncbi:MAG: RNA polymerase sigma factor [Eubacterium sp.]|nr:RNA polymerase sigma factor [Eubacterium sp.]
MTKPELETCMIKYGKDIYSFCRSLVGSIQEAEDLYQDTFLKAIELNEKIDAAGNPKSYLLSIAVRIWKNRKRKYAWRKRIADFKSYTEGQDVEEEISAASTPEEHALRLEEVQTVRRLVAGLPERLRVIVLLYYMEELTVPQIAEILHIPQGTVKSRMYQARKALQKELEVFYEEGYQ